MRVPEYARRVGVTTDTVYRWIRKGLLPNVKKIKGSIWIDEEVDDTKLGEIREGIKNILHEVRQLARRQP